MGSHPGKVRRGRLSDKPPLFLAPFSFAGIVLFALLAWQAGGAAWGQIPLPIPGLNPTNPLNLFSKSTQPNQPLSLGAQLLYLRAEEMGAAESPSDSLLAFLVAAPLFYNASQSGGSASPAWTLDPQAELLGSGPAGKGLLFTGTIGVDTELNPDNSGYNLDTLTGLLQFNFTNKGIHFKAAPFIAYKTGFTVPADFPGHAWVSDFEAGYNFNGILGTGRSPRDRLEIDFNPSLSQRWVQVDDGQGGGSTSGSSALEAEIPVSYKISSRLDLLLDFTASTRIYDTNQDAQDQNRQDLALSCPVLLDWTVVPDSQFHAIALASYTQQFSSLAGEDFTQLSVGIELQKWF